MSIATATRPARRLLPRLHAAAGLTGFTLVLSFWTATVLSELFGGGDTIAAVKQAIAWALLALVPALATAGATGFRLAGRVPSTMAATTAATLPPRLAAKKRRMPLIAANGVLVLVPCALVLARLSGQGDFGPTFQAVQALELAAGALNLTLMALTIRDGLALTGRIGG